MSSPDLQNTRSKLRALASELVTLADTYEPTSQHAIGWESPFVEKAKLLTSTAQTSMEYSLGLITSSTEIAVVQTLYSIKALQAIPNQGSISLEDVSAATNADPLLLERLFRVLLGTCFLKQTTDGAYAHTPRSIGFVEGAYPGNFLSFLYTAGVEVMTRFPEYLEYKRSQTITAHHPHGYYAEPGGIDGATHNPTTWRHNAEGRTIFEIYAERPAEAARFQKIMASVALINPFTGFYDFDRLLCPSDPTRPVIVDIGGGHGPALSHLLAAHPQIQPEQCVLQDLAHVVDSAHAGNTDLPRGVHLQAYDYFAAQPVRGARAYHLRAIAHDLSDENLVRVLRRCGEVMAPDSRVLIADNVLPEKGAKGLSGLMDMMMMVIAGKERTERDFVRVCKDAGLVVEKVWFAGGQSTYAMVEARLAGPETRKAE